MIKGKQQVLRNLNNAINQISSKSKRALEEIGADIINDSIAITPEEHGNLRESAFYNVQKSSRDTYRLSVGYSAEYAPYVHEAKEKMRGEYRPSLIGPKYWDPQGERKFLEKSINKNKPRMIRIAANNLRSIR